MTLGPLPKAAQGGGLCLKTPKGPGRDGPKGFTLAEVLISSALLGLAFVALVSACGHDSVATQASENLTVGTYLADEIRDMALRMDFHEVLNLDGTTFNPAVLSTGDAEDLVNWSQQVSVTPVSVQDINEAIDAGDAEAACLNVEVLHSGQLVLAQAYCLVDKDSISFTDSVSDGGTDGADDDGGGSDDDGGDDDGGDDDIGWWWQWW